LKKIEKEKLKLKMIEILNNNNNNNIFKKRRKDLTKEKK